MDKLTHERGSGVSSRPEGRGFHAATLMNETQLTVTGNLVDNPELRFTPSGSRRPSSGSPAPGIPAGCYLGGVGLVRVPAK